MNETQESHETIFFDSFVQRKSLLPSFHWLAILKNLFENITNQINQTVCISYKFKLYIS